ncbi:hypothetical protein A3C26_00015 [Candidatus Daviesbacteria bacterium RIFCSPHIGHO2_02_FULL_39_12]|uniref:Uncharacterized protein n=2 Tax=Candidatus Daviesiibacteriota TaxID=1752718 RepID=A0A1F5JBZ5_9BACT|nr:MAG: hypothetical protein A3C26_00015 [Candidatus Daviesbacteria bacterium RIFCSPHIGHO2_02_FULL_39_12]OGE71345.1 MAG: hypothetical protein A3H40_03565 [Candidatus Daviesbacteria bacterium RIFCSPLOWO2_02_FULL_38_15]
MIPVPPKALGFAKKRASFILLGGVKAPFLGNERWTQVALPIHLGKSDFPATEMDFLLVSLTFSQNS